MKHLLTIPLFILVFLSACKDPCKDVNCNDGTCLEGICLCDDGFEGEFCDKEERAKFYGTWTGDLDCGSQIGQGEGSITITEDPDRANGVLVNVGFELLDLEPAAGIVAGKNLLITNYTQTIDIFGQMAEVTIGGDGVFNDDETVSLNITITTILGTLNCSGLLSKG